jgi:hypothetical protein
VKLSHLALNVKEIMGCSQNGSEYIFLNKMWEMRDFRLPPRSR